MKIRILVLLVLCCISFRHQAQTKGDTTVKSSSKMYSVSKNDGTVFVGRILSQDAREVLIETKELGQIYIPKHEIKEIREIKAGELTAQGAYIPSEVFSTRYVITTNGLPIEKGESYIQWNLFGPDFQFGVGKNFGVGIMTTWLGFPVLGSAKYSLRLSDDVHLGLGTLLGTGSWALPNFGIALPFAALTFGDRRANINFSGGYGAVFNRGDTEGRVLGSIAGMAKIGKKMSFVFDSFIIFDARTSAYGATTASGSPGLVLFTPALRWQMEPRKAFQFGFTGIIVGSDIVPVPLPTVQWYRKL